MRWKGKREGVTHNNYSRNLKQIHDTAVVDPEGTCGAQSSPSLRLTLGFVRLICLNFDIVVGICLFGKRLFLIRRFETFFLTEK